MFFQSTILTMEKRFLESSPLKRWSKFQKNEYVFLGQSKITGE